MNNSKSQTNADKIRKMTDEELAEVIICPYDAEPELCHKFCLDCCLEWLQKPCELKTESKRKE